MCYTSGMAKTTPRLHVEAELSVAGEIILSKEQSHYLINVLRMATGDAVLVFNSANGEWLAYITEAGKKSVLLRCEKCKAGAVPPPDIDYLFAPLKHQRLDYLVQKATELGARRLRPVITARTVAERVNLERMRANVIEAAEQCNLVFVPEVLEPQKFDAVLRDWDAERTLIFCDETAIISDPIQILETVKPPAAIIVGPEGGFTEDERRHLKSLPFVKGISLGPRIMRADTAAVAVLALVQAVMGDWHKP
jgi:16S rRNA (uracil1498-N3)-methyltransferase